MNFTNIRDLKYSSADNSTINLFATCEEFGEIPMTLNIVDTEDLHEYFDGKDFHKLEEYCKKKSIAKYVEPEVIKYVPSSITMRQARLYLYSVDKLEDVEAMVETRKDWQIEWEYTSEVERSSLLISIIKDKLEFSDIEVDDIFIAASKL